MSGEQAVAHRFVAFLVKNITLEIGQIKKETQNETAQFAAERVKSHCEELQQAIDTLFAVREQQPNDPPAPQSNGNRRRASNA